jgi:hypothetical protein
MDQSKEDEDIPTETATYSSTSQYIDKITLELLINKNQYNKYLASANPEKHKRITEFSEKLAKYGDKILSLTEDYCLNPKTQKTTEMDETFANYAKTCFRYFEMKELEGDPDSYQNESSRERDEDVLFDPAPMRSFWGKGATKKY